MDKDNKILKRLKELANLIKKHNIKFLDLLFVDAEGYDGKIVYDFLLNTSFKPLEENAPND